MPRAFIICLFFQRLHIPPEKFIIISCGYIIFFIIPAAIVKRFLSTEIE